MLEYKAYPWTALLLRLDSFGWLAVRLSSVVPCIQQPAGSFDAMGSMFDVCCSIAPIAQTLQAATNLFCWSSRGIAYWCDMQAFMGEVYASFFFIFVLMGMVIDKRCDTCLYGAIT